MPGHCEVSERQANSGSIHRPRPSYQRRFSWGPAMRRRARPVRVRLPVTPGRAIPAVTPRRIRGTNDGVASLGAHVDEPERTRHTWGRRRVVAGTIAVIRRVAPSAAVVTSPVTVIVSPAAILRPSHPCARRRGRSGVRDSRANSQGNRPERSNNHCTRRELLHFNHRNLNLNTGFRQRHNAIR